MKVKKQLLDDIKVNSNFGRFICCSLYLNTKHDQYGATIHEQVALLTLKGNDTEAIAKKTGFKTETVTGALYDIIAFCEAKE